MPPTTPPMIAGVSEIPWWWWCGRDAEDADAEGDGVGVPQWDTFDTQNLRSDVMFQKTHSRGHGGLHPGCSVGSQRILQFRWRKIVSTCKCRNVIEMTLRTLREQLLWFLSLYSKVHCPLNFCNAQYSVLLTGFRKTKTSARTYSVWRNLFWDTICPGSFPRRFKLRFLPNE